MKLIIEIPEEEYIKICDEPCTELALAVRNGTVLPKKHGRIADMDEAIKCIEDVTGDDAIYAISLIEWACRKRTIIEADKERNGMNEVDN